MPPKTIKKKSSPKRRPALTARSTGTTPRRSSVGSVGEELFAKAFRSSPHPIGITELETGRCLEVNDACLAIFGFRRDEVVGQTTLMLGIWPDPQERVQFIDRLKGEGKVRNLEVSMRMKDGERRQFIISTDLITLGGKRCLMTIGNDITERKKAEEALRESEQRFHAIYDQTYEFIGLLTPDGTLIDVNQTALAFRGVQRSEVVGKLFWETPWWDLSRELRDKLKTGIAEAATGTFVRLRAQHRSQEGAIEEIDFSLTPITDRTGEVTQIIPEGRRITPLTKIQDQLRQAYEELEQRVAERTTELKRVNECLQTEVAERKQAEEAVREKQRELQQSQAQLQDLTAKLFSAQDSERQRIARDLHDDFSQRLTALVLGVASLAKHPPRLPKLLGKALEPVCKELEQLTSDLHDLAYRLHPPLLRHAGLQAAIEDHIDKAIERTGLQIVLKVKDLPGAIPLDWSLCLFRVFQESLQNVVKHAKATEVLVKLSGSSKGVGLSVIDNGKGFDKHDKSGHQKGLGLISMQERLRLLNGFLNIHSGPADGTKVCAWIPFQEQTP